MADAGSPQTTERAGFWRRALAILIDLALIAFISTITGVLLFGPTDGRIRVGSALIDFTRCSRVDPQQLTLPDPPPFHITNADRCTKAFFGIVHDRILRVAEITHSGATTYTRWMTYPVDADGHVTKAFYTDYLTLIVLVAYVLLLEWRYGWTLGKRVMHIRVQSLGGGPITFIQAVIRSAVRFLPWPLFALPFILPLFTSYEAFFAFAASTTAKMLILVTFIAALVFIANYVAATCRRKLPCDDRLAGTEVVRN
jgi:uncharacterized RDD family membrane protein YckC